MGGMPLQAFDLTTKFGFIIVARWDYLLENKQFAGSLLPSALRRLPTKTRRAGICVRKFFERNKHDAEFQHHG